MKKELRVDPTNNDIIIFARERASRPLDNVKKNMPMDEDDIIKEYEENCPFCRGNEHQTDDSTEEIFIDGKWVAKAIKNKYPIVDMNSDEVFGVHEVIIESYRHNANFFNMSEEEFKTMFKLYLSRYKYLMNQKGIEYVNLFKNFLRKSGASLMHPHAQITALSIIPTEIHKELLVAHDYYGWENTNLYEDIIKEEKEYKERLVYSGTRFIAIIPSASKNPSEVRIIFNKGVKFEDLDSLDIDELSYAFKGIFANYKKMFGIMPFNIWVHSHPNGIETKEYFNLHIHIFPRKFNYGGFELSTGMYVSSYPPEDIAKQMRIEEE